MRPWLEFRSNNAAHQPMIQALALLKRYAASKARLFAPKEEIPLDGVVPPGWLDTVVRVDARGRRRIDRINYEICVLQTLREKLRCREVWVAGALPTTLHRRVASGGTLLHIFHVTHTPTRICPPISRRSATPTTRPWASPATPTSSSGDCKMS